MADRTSAVCARLLQMFFALHRAGSVMLTRVPREFMAGEHLKVVSGPIGELRNFTDPREAEQFVRTAIEEGDAVGIGWSPDEIEVYHQLQAFGQLLAAGPVDALIIGPAGAARRRLVPENLCDAAQVLGTAALLGVQVLVEQEVRE